RRLKEQAFLLAEFLEKKAPQFQPPPLRRRAVVHGHCHQKALAKMDCDEAVLRKLGLDFEVLDSGCCGMAASFGYEREHYEVAERCGERVLLPRVRAAPKDALVSADGFSSREQIRAGSGGERRRRAAG